VLALLGTRPTRPRERGRILLDFGDRGGNDNNEEVAEGNGLVSQAQHGASSASEAVSSGSSKNERRGRAPVGCKRCTTRGSLPAGSSQAACRERVPFISTDRGKRERSSVLWCRQGKRKEKTSEEMVWRGKKEKGGEGLFYSRGRKGKQGVAAVFFFFF
jgi:hypothetical protein